MATPSSRPRRVKSSSCTGTRLLLFTVAVLAALMLCWRTKISEISNISSSSSAATTKSASQSKEEEMEAAFMAIQFENANAKIAERQNWLTRSSETSWFGNLTATQLWYLFPPSLPCVWTLEKKPSVVELHDGGKWLCGMQQVDERRRRSDDAEYGVGKHYEKEPCIVYSMGSCNKFDFESRVRTLAPGCEIHTFDPTYAETGKGKVYYDSYHGDYGFGGKDDNSKGKKGFPTKSLATIMRELGHAHVDYLKIDVEGYEWEFLDEVDWTTVRVGQLLMEWHPSRNGKDFFGRRPNAREMNQIFTKLEEGGFYLITLEPVTFTNFGQVEVVFIHKDWRPQGWVQSSPDSIAPS